MNFIEPTDVLEIISKPRVNLEELALFNRGVGVGATVQIRFTGRTSTVSRWSGGGLGSPLLASLLN